MSRTGYLPPEKQPPVWVRATREPRPGDWRALAFVVLLLIVLFVLCSLGLPPSVLPPGVPA